MNAERQEQVWLKFLEQEAKKTLSSDDVEFYRNLSGEDAAFIVARCKERGLVAEEEFCFLLTLTKESVCCS